MCDDVAIVVHVHVYAGDPESARQPCLNMAASSRFSRSNSHSCQLIVRRSVVWASVTVFVGSVYCGISRSFFLFSCFIHCSVYGWRFRALFALIFMFKFQPFVHFTVPQVFTTVNRVLRASASIMSRSAAELEEKEKKMLKLSGDFRCLQLQPFCDECKKDPDVDTRDGAGASVATVNVLFDDETSKVNVVVRNLSLLKNFGIGYWRPMQSTKDVSTVFTEPPLYFFKEMIFHYM